MPATRMCGGQHCFATRRDRCKCEEGTVGSLKEEPKNAKNVTKVVVTQGDLALAPNAPSSSAKPPPATGTGVPPEAAAQGALALETQEAVTTLAPSSCAERPPAYPSIEVQQQDQIPDTDFDAAMKVWKVARSKIQGRRDNA